MMGLKERAFARDPSRCPWRSWFPRTIFTAMCKKFWTSRLYTNWFASAMLLLDDRLLTPVLATCGIRPPVEAFENTQSRL
jgi:hypothetical protein